MDQQKLAGAEGEIPAMKFVICLLSLIVIASFVVKLALIVVNAMIFVAKITAIVLAVSVGLYVVFRGLFVIARQLWYCWDRSNRLTSSGRSRTVSGQRKLARDQHRTGVASRPGPEPTTEIVTSAEGDVDDLAGDEGQIGSEIAINLDRIFKVREIVSSEYSSVARASFLHAILSTHEEFAATLGYISSTAGDSSKGSTFVGKEVTGLLAIVAEPHDPLDAEISKLGTVEHAEFSKSLQIIVGRNSRIECNTRYRVKRLQIDFANFFEDIGPRAQEKLGLVVNNPDDQNVLEEFQSALDSMNDHDPLDEKERRLEVGTVQNLRITTRRCAVIVESNGSRISSTVHHAVAVGDLDIIVLLRENADLISHLGRFLHEPNSQSKNSLDRALAGAVTDRHLETLLTGATFDKVCPRVRGVRGNLQADRVPMAVIDPVSRVDQHYSITASRPRMVGTSQLINSTGFLCETQQREPPLLRGGLSDKLNGLYSSDVEPPKKRNRKGFSI